MQKGVIWTLKSALVIASLYALVVFILMSLFLVAETVQEIQGMNLTEVGGAIMETISSLGSLLVVFVAGATVIALIPFLLISSITGLFIGLVVSFMNRRNAAGFLIYLPVVLLLSAVTLIWEQLGSMFLGTSELFIVHLPILIYFVTCLFITRRLIAEARRMRGASA